MLSYNAWMKLVDKRVQQMCGLSLDELPDWLSRDAFEDGLTPNEGADLCLESAGIDADVLVDEY